MQRETVILWMLSPAQKAGVVGIVPIAPAFFVLTFSVANAWARKAALSLLPFSFFLSGSDCFADFFRKTLVHRLTKKLTDSIVDSGDTQLYHLKIKEDRGEI